MTDFLTRLAERSLGVGEVVQPRPASLFDPRGAVDAPTLVGDLEVVERRIAVRPSQTPAQRAAAPQPAEGPRAAAERLPAPPPGAVDAPGPVESSGGSEPHSAQTAAAASAPPPPSVAPALAAEAAGDDARPPAPVPTTVVVQATRVELREPDGTPPERPRRRAHTAQVPPPSVPARPPDGGERELAASSSPAALEPDWRNAPPAPAQARAPAAETPVVHVTIGRVDVRAVLPAPPPERAAPRHRPRLTLDEYLRKDGRR